jgi:hypothetical protein
LLRRQVFLKISFLNTQQPAFFTAKLIAFAFSRQQQRGEILICFRSVVKCFLKILSNPSAPADSLKPASKAFQLHPSPSSPATVSGRSAVISEAHDCSTGFSADASVVRIQGLSPSGPLTESESSPADRL